MSVVRKLPRYGFVVAAELVTMLVALQLVLDRDDQCRGAAHDEQVDVLVFAPNLDIAQGGRRLRDAAKKSPQEQVRLPVALRRIQKPAEEVGVLHFPSGDAERIEDIEGANRRR